MIADNDSIPSTAMIWRPLVIFAAALISEVSILAHSLLLAFFALLVFLCALS